MRDRRDLRYPPRAPAPRTPHRAPADPRLKNVRRLAFLMDAMIPIPGTRWRIGLDPLIGLIPGIGDALAGLAALYPILVAAQLGAPPSVLARMGVNVGVDALVGAVPLLGDLLDVGYRANTRNVAVAEEWLAAPRETRRSSRAVVALVVVAVVLVVAAVLFAVGSLVAWAYRAAG